MGELVQGLTAAGFEDVRVVRSFDPFIGASKERTARRYRVRGVNLLGIKRPQSD